MSLKSMEPVLGSSPSICLSRCLSVSASLKADSELVSFVFCFSSSKIFIGGLAKDTTLGNLFLLNFSVCILVLFSFSLDSK